MHRQFQDIEQSLRAEQRISVDDAKWLWKNASDSELISLANIVRDRFHEPGSATYLLMRIINYTNVCVAKCDYCSFYRLPRANDTYVRSKEWIFEKIDELVEIGGDFFGFNGGFNPELKIDYYCDLFSSIRERYGDSIEFYALTVVELIYIARVSRISVPEALQRLKAAGVRWITGGGAEVLADSFRKRHSPLKYTVQEYMEAQGQILEAGLKTTATMVIGFDETIEERLEHLDTVRKFQDETKGGLFSFLAWTYKPYNNELGGHEISSEEYLRHIALCRIFFDNIKFIRTSVLTQNANALKGLRYGANDFDIPFEDEVTEKAGAIIERDVPKVLSYAEAEGFRPVYRQISLKPKAIPAAIALS
ncbi:MAG: radical SAM protein [Candidatus Obscuribacterales bacterium]|nr:radical SAM protein [Candidatus Obscuribacterales bacterium]